MIIKYLALSLFLVLSSGCVNKEEAVKKTEVDSPKPPSTKVKDEYKVKSFITDSGINLFQENTKYKIGDIITIILEENMAAKKAAKTSTKKGTTNKIDSPIMFGITPKITGSIPDMLGNTGGTADLSFGYGSTNDWSGDGSSSQSNSLTGEISVFVIGKTATGNLIIKGEKNLLINTGSEKVVLTGIIRTDDISSENTIVSTKVANADIRYYGSGVVSDVNEQGLVTKLFNNGLGLW